VKLTNGATEEIRHRYVALDPKEEFIDTQKPLYLNLYGEWTKRSGYARLRSGAQAERLVWLDKNVSRLAKAKDADVYAYSVMAFDDSPDYFVGGANLADARQATETNPFQKDYAWGRAELIEYKNSAGVRLQGILDYPANYEPGKQYPMIVYIYEKLSQGLHVYYTPSERSPYNPSVFTSRGYFVLHPDIVFRERDPGLSIVDSVTAAVNKVLEKGSVDRNRLGLVGHSWGGYGTAFTATQTDLFKAAVAGAALTNLVSMYGSVFWNSGRPETDHFEVGQERMQVPLWEDREAYLRNSPVFSVHKMKTPLLMAFGDNDGSVDWSQGIEMYNLARRAGKDFVLLVYPGENHGLRKRPNQIDYHRRIIEWFGHYLQGAPAPEWMTKGVSHLEREQELKRIRESKAAKKATASPTPQ
jgi:dipeptidyl aminopeptidase/acylaminoacyl peptidase